MRNQKVGHWLGIKLSVLAVFCFATMFLVGGCAWVREWLSPNRTPVPVIVANPLSGKAPLEVFFDASHSYDPDGDQLVDFLWDFGDSLMGRGVFVCHGFSAPGEYTVRLTVTDVRGARSSTTVNITVWEPLSSVTEHEFDGQAGTVFDTGLGLVISIAPGAVRGEAKLLVSRISDVGNSGAGTLVPFSVYDVKLETLKTQGVAALTAASSRLATLTFDIPPDIDPEAAVILVWTEAGWLPALSYSGDCLGGELTPDRMRISIEVSHFSNYALGYVKRITGSDTVVITPSEASVTEDGDLSFDLTLEPPRIGIISSGVWYGIEAPTGIGCKNISSPSDPLFGQSLGNMKICFLGPTETKVLRYLFWGTGGRTSLRLSMRAGLPAALMDILFRLATGLPMPWPFPSLEEWKRAARDALIEGDIDLLVSAAENVADELIKKLSVSEWLTKVWTWAKGLIRFLDFHKALITLKYSVDQLAHYFFNYKTGGEIHYEVLGSVAAKVNISPKETLVAPGKSVQFRATLTTLDVDARVLSVLGGFRWETSGGGVIDETGLFTADAQARGRFVVKAVVTTYFGPNGERKPLSEEAYVIVQPTAVKPNPPRPLEPGEPAAPGPIVSSLTPTFRWEGVANADRYALAISVEPYGSANVIYRNENLTGTFFQVPNGVLHYGKKYRWNMQAGNSAGWSDVSTTLYFQTPPPPSSFDFEISVDPLSKTTTQKGVVSTTVRAWKTAGPDTRVDFTVSGAPAGVSVEPITWSWILGEQNRVLTFSVGADAPAGTYTIKIKGTGGGATKEKTFTLTVTAAPPQLPDLAVEEIWTDPNPPFTASYVNIEVKVRNQGTADITRAFLLTVRLSNVYVSTVTIEGLTAGSVYNFKGSAKWPSDTNPYIIEAIVDPDDRIQEVNEGNNKLTKQVKAVIPPQPVGTLFISSDPGEADVYVDDQYKGKTPAETTLELAIPNLSVGEHTVRVTKSGYNDSITTVTISAGSEVRLRVRLSIITPPVDHLPEIIQPQPNEVVQAEVGKLFTYQIKAYDPDGQPLVYVLQHHPSDMAVDHSIGMIRWTPGSSWAGRRAEVSFYVSDRPLGQTSGREVYRTFYIDVREPPNQPPVAVIRASPTAGEAPLTVNFDGSGSYDPDGRVVSYKWSFGDGSGGDGVSTSHTFSNPGTYTVVLTVTDDKGATGKDTISINVAIAFDFDISISPTSWMARQNDMTSVVVRAWRTAGLTTSVTFNVTGLPSGITANPSSWVWNLGAESSTITFSVFPSAPVGTHTIIVTANGGGKRKTAAFSITVTGKFKAGDPVIVYGTGGTGVRVRKTPCGEKIGTQPDGANGIVLEGPVECALDGKVYRWWKIRWADGLVGWSVEDYLGLAMG